MDSRPYRHPEDTVMNRKLLYALAVAVLIALGLLPFLTPRTGALPSSEVEIYYLDINGDIVGYSFRGCSGERITDGVVTTNRMAYGAPCSNPQGSVQCRWDGLYVSCAANMFWDLCTDHYGAALCSP
jgi:hypothetical protein